jgi:hypothetical protein
MKKLYTVDSCRSSSTAPGVSDAKTGFNSEQRERLCILLSDTVAAAADETGQVLAARWRRLQSSCPVRCESRENQGGGRRAGDALGAGWIALVTRYRRSAHDTRAVDLFSNMDSRPAEVTLTFVGNSRSPATSHYCRTLQSHGHAVSRSLLQLNRSAV